MKRKLKSSFFRSDELFCLKTSFNKRLLRKLNTKFFIVCNSVGEYYYIDDLWPTQSLGQCHDMRTGTDITQVCIKLSSAHKGYDDGYRFFDF